MQYKLPVGSLLLLLVISLEAVYSEWHSSWGLPMPNPPNPLLLIVIQ